MEIARREQMEHRSIFAMNDSFGDLSDMKKDTIASFVHWYKTLQVLRLTLKEALPCDMDPVTNWLSELCELKHIATLSVKEAYLPSRLHTLAPYGRLTVNWLAQSLNTLSSITERKQVAIFKALRNCSSATISMVNTLQRLPPKLEDHWCQCFYWGLAHELDDIANALAATIPAPLLSSQLSRVLIGLLGASSLSLSRCMWFPIIVFAEKKASVLFCLSSTSKCLERVLREGIFPSSASQKLENYVLMVSVFLPFCVFFFLPFFFSISDPKFQY